LASNAAPSDALESLRADLAAWRAALTDPLPDAVTYSVPGPGSIWELVNRYDAALEAAEGERDLLKGLWDQRPIVSRERDTAKAHVPALREALYEAVVVLERPGFTPEQRQRVAARGRQVLEQTKP
jgi:hypothetical protein